MNDKRKVLVVPLVQSMTVQTNRTTTETYLQVDCPGTEHLGPHLESIQALSVTKNCTANMWWEAVVSWTNDGVNLNTPFTGLCGAGITADGQAIQTAVTSGFGGRIMRFGIGVKNASGSSLESAVIWVWLVLTFKT